MTVVCLRFSCSVDQFGGCGSEQGYGWGLPTLMRLGLWFRFSRTRRAERRRKLWWHFMPFIHFLLTGGELCNVGQCWFCWEFPISSSIGSLKFWVCWLSAKKGENRWRGLMGVWGFWWEFWGMEALEESSMPC